MGLGTRLLLTSVLAFCIGSFIAEWFDPSTLDPRLRTELEHYKAIPEREASLSTLHGFDPGDQPHQRVGSKELYSWRKADTTAVVLNWSRFPNVRLIASLLCGSWLDGVIAEVFIWNNNPKNLSRKVRMCPSNPSDTLSDRLRAIRTSQAQVVHHKSYEFTILLPMNISRRVSSRVRRRRHHTASFK